MKRIRNGKRAEESRPKGGGSARGRLSAAEKIRYSRQCLIRQWGGAKGQLKLKRSKVLVAGAGGSGSPLLFYLAAAGVGTIRVCDNDSVEESNLNRQIIHDQERIGMNKALSAAVSMRKLNSEIEVEAYPIKLSARNIARLANGCDLICSAVDDYEAMRVMNRYSFKNRVPLLWGGGFYLGGFLSLLMPPETFCLECFLAYSDASKKLVREGLCPEKEHMLVEEGEPLPIVGAAAGVAGSMQAMEAIKYLVGFGPLIKNTMMYFQLGGDESMFSMIDGKQIRRPGCAWCNAKDRKGGRRGSRLSKRDL